MIDVFVIRGNVMAIETVGTEVMNGAAPQVKVQSNATYECHSLVYPHIT